MVEGIGIENQGIEQLASDFSEVITSVMERRDVKLEMESLDRLLVAFDVVKGSIEYMKQVVDSREEIATEFERTVFGIKSEVELETDAANIEDPTTAENGKVGVDESATPQAEINNNSDDRLAADTVSALALAETVEVGDALVEIEFNTEAQFLLDVFKSKADDDELTRSDFDTAGFLGLKQRNGSAHNQAFRTGMVQLIDAGLAKRISRGRYQFVGGNDKTFLDQQH